MISLGRLSLPTVLLTILLTSSAESKPPRIYEVRSGDTLGRIAERHRVTIDSICRANAISRRSLIRPGQRLVVPFSSDEVRGQGGPAAEERRLPKSIRAEVERKASDQEQDNREEPSTRSRNRRKASRTLPRKENSQGSSFVLESSLFTPYHRTPPHAGVVRVSSGGRVWTGSVLDTDGKVSTRARAAFRALFGSRRTGKQEDISGRMMRLLAQTSDYFGGRRVQVVSGYREISSAEGSRHKSGMACDFSLEGVPNVALFSYLLTLPYVGVGYYPNSTFVHLDVRKTKTVWVDLSGPGEEPRYVDPREFFGP